MSQIEWVEEGRDRIGRWREGRVKASPDVTVRVMWDVSEVDDPGDLAPSDLGAILFGRGSLLDCFAEARDGDLVGSADDIEILSTDVHRMAKVEERLVGEALARLAKRRRAPIR